MFFGLFFLRGRMLSASKPEIKEDFAVFLLLPEQKKTVDRSQILIRKRNTKINSVHKIFGGENVFVPMNKGRRITTFRQIFRKSFQEIRFERKKFGMKNRIEIPLFFNDRRIVLEMDHHILFNFKFYFHMLFFVVLKVALVYVSLGRCSS